MLAEGDNALLQERNEIVQGLRSLGKDDEKKYRALRGRENVLEQFRKIETAHQVVGMREYVDIGAFGPVEFRLRGEREEQRDDADSHQELQHVRTVSPDLRMEFQMECYVDERGDEGTEGRHIRGFGRRQVSGLHR